jgi:hypothetical protein
MRSSVFNLCQVWVPKRRFFDAKRAKLSACGANLTILGGKRGVEKKRIPYGGLKIRTLVRYALLE